MRKRKSGFISFALSIMLIAVLVACAPQPEYPAGHIGSNNGPSGFVPAVPEYIIDLGGEDHKIEIYRQGSNLLYAIDPDGGKVFEDDEIKAVVDKVGQEGYSILDISFYPQGDSSPSIMFVYLGGSEAALGQDQDKDDVLILLEDFLGG